MTDAVEAHKPYQAVHFIDLHPLGWGVKAMSKGDVLWLTDAERDAILEIAPESLQFAYDLMDD